MKKNKKSNILNLLIFTIVIILIGGILIITSNIIKKPQQNKEKTQVEENIEENISNNIPTNITTAEEMINLLENTQKKEGYSFAHKQTEGNQIIINQINTETKEVLNEYVYDIETNTMSVKSYSTNTNSTTSK